MRASLRRLALLCLVRPSTLSAQVAVDSLDRRFSFAELYTGVDLATLPAGGKGSGALDLPARVIPRLTIGGLHFWGHADFAVTVALGRAVRGDGAARSRLGTGIETRGRWYLRPASTDGLSPFVGAGLGATDLQVGDGPRVYRMQPMAQAGLVWRQGRTLMEGGWSARAHPLRRYPISRTELRPVSPTVHALFLGMHRTFETTAGLKVPLRTGVWGDRERALRDAGRLSGPTLAIGASSPILTGSTERNREVRPFLAQRPRGRPLLDLGAGWYAHDVDAQLNLAWRRARFSTEAFDFAQHAERQSLVLEGFKSSATGTASCRSSVRPWASSGCGCANSTAPPPSPTGHAIWWLPA